MACAFALLGGVACASESEDGKSHAGTGGAAGEGDAAAAGAAGEPSVPDAGMWNNQYTVTHHDAGPLPPSKNFVDVKDPWPADTADACKAFASDYPVSRACLCDGCLDLMHQCDALPGCIEIRACIWKVGCTDPNTCYLLKLPGDPAGCVDVIDKWGNTGDDVAIATATLQCGQNLKPACPQPAK